MLIILGSFLLGLAWTAVLARVYVRTRMIKKWGMSDTLLIGSIVCQSRPSLFVDRRD